MKDLTAEKRFNNITEICINCLLTVPLPFLILYWMVPFLSKHTIGHDYYSGYWIDMQLFLQFSIKNGTFPLYAPGFNFGWTSSALSLGQMWHPITWLASSLPEYWEGHAHEIVTMLRLISLGFTQLVLLSVLKRIKVSRVLAFVFSFIAVYNLRMLDMFRYGASLENYIAFLLLSAVLIWYYVSSRKYAGPLCIIGCTWLMMVGGHPQMMYYGFIGAVLICAIVPFYVRSLHVFDSADEYKPVGKYYLGAAASMLAGILLAGCYLMPFYFEYMRDSWRGGQTEFAWACRDEDVPTGIVYNFFNPFYSDVHGAYGGTALFAAAAITPLAYIFKAKIPWSIMLLWGFCLMVIILSLGSRGFLYYYFWKYFPLAQSIHVPQRMTFVLPVLFMLILVWLSQLKPQVVTMTAAAAIILFAVFNGLNIDKTSLAKYCPLALNNPPNYVIMCFFITSIVTLASLAFIQIERRRLRLLFHIIIAFSVLLGTAAVLRYGTWIEKAPRKTFTFEQLSRFEKTFLVYPAETGDWSRKMIEEHVLKTFFDPIMARICTDYTFVNDADEFYQKVAMYNSYPTHVYIENIPGLDIPDKSLNSENRSSVALEYNTFNMFCFRVNNSTAGFFVFSPPFERWRAYVDGEGKPICRANGIENTIWLEAGQHKVEFRYWSIASIAGMTISVLVLFAVSVFVLKDISSLYFRAACIISFVLCCLILIFWYGKLYTGKNIGTQFFWSYDSQRDSNHLKNNLAYGKITNMSGNALSKEYLSLSSFGVDGSYLPMFSFTTNTQPRSWWQVDLGKTHPVSNVKLFSFRVGSDDYCSLPFGIQASEDGNNWTKIATIEDYSGEYWNVELEKPINTRYIRLETVGTGNLAFSEVEVYGPENNP
jgi:hypothetical protein